MNFVRFTDKKSPVEMKGLYIDEKITRIHGSFFGQFTITEEEYSLSDIQLLPPILPQTICCLGKRSYIKSAAALSAGGTVKMKHEKLSCTPRAGIIIREKGPAAFGSCLMLDFAPDTLDYSASSYGYTIMNSINKGVQDIACTFNGINLGISADDLLAGMKEVAGYIALTAGDIVAMPLAKASTCQRGDSFVLKGRPELKAVLA